MILFTLAAALLWLQKFYNNLIIYLQISKRALYLHRIQGD